MTPGRLLLALAASVAIAAPLAAQRTTDLGTGRGGSAHVKTEWNVRGAHIAIAYGRPTLKGRDENTLMPPGSVWRTGADAATVITTDKPLTFGRVVLQPGSYTINTQPGASAWQLIFGKLAQEGQWGVPYQPQLEIARTPMTLARLTKPVEQLTIHVDVKAGAPQLRIEWGTASATAPFTVGK